LHKATSHPPDAVVLDVMMPGMDGYDVGRGIKANPPTAALPIVFLTARAQDEDREAGLALGDVDYLTKPFDPAELVALVRRRVAGAGA
jgi:putative two-component system response regulator